jgi:hypothetical protein
LILACAEQNVPELGVKACIFFAGVPHFIWKKAGNASSTTFPFTERSAATYINEAYGLLTYAETRCEHSLEGSGAMQREVQNLLVVLSIAAC